MTEIEGSRITAKEIEEGEGVEVLKGYSACDISDALLALNPSQKHAGFLADIRIFPYPSHLKSSITNNNPVPYNSPTSPTSPTSSKETPIIAPAFTVEFIAKPISTTSPNERGNFYRQCEDSNIPNGQQWSDLITPSTIVVISQPEGLTNAVMGGIHALRCEKLGARGVVVDGRIRDLTEMGILSIPVFAKSHSTVGAGASCEAVFIQIPIKMSEVSVYPGDLIFLDKKERSVVSIPSEQVGDVIKWLEKRGDTEERVKGFVENGGSVGDAFKLRT